MKKNNPYIVIFIILIVGHVISAIADPNSNPDIVAVIDTGIDRGIAHLCNDNHKSFVDEAPLQDNNGHGTHIAGLINKHAENGGNYCLVAVKFFDNKSTGRNNIKVLSKSLRYAIDIGAKYINVSGGGPSLDKEEQGLIKEALDKGIHVVVAAGNDGEDLDKKCNYFPACYGDKRLNVVGNLKDTLNRSPISNYGFKVVNKWEIGVDVESTLPNGARGKLSGTSQAAAVFSGKLIKLTSQGRN